MNAVDEFCNATDWGIAFHTLLRQNFVAPYFLPDKNGEELKKDPL